VGQRRKLLEVRELTVIDLFHRMVVIEEWRQIMRNDPAPEPQLVRSLATLFSLIKRLSGDPCGAGAGINRACVRANA
jgi:hypothetical protein